MRLAEEVLEVVSPATGMVIELGMLPADASEDGMYRLVTPNMIWICPSDVCSPTDVVETVIHELAHAKLYQMEHFGPDCNSYCRGWQYYCRMLMQCFKKQTLDQEFTLELWHLSVKYGVDWRDVLIQNEGACSECSTVRDLPRVKGVEREVERELEKNKNSS